MFGLVKQQPVEPTSKGIARSAEKSFRQIGFVLDEPISSCLMAKYSGKVPAQNLPSFTYQVQYRSSVFAREANNAMEERKFSKNKHITDAVLTGMFADAFFVTPAAFLLSLGNAGATLLADALFLGLMIIRGATYGRKRFRNRLESMADDLIKKIEQYASRKASD